MISPIMKSWDEFAIKKMGLSKIWRFSDNMILKLISRLICRCGFHVWIYFDGRPTNCGVCGKIGHPLAYNDLNKILEEQIEKRYEKMENED